MPCLVVIGQQLKEKWRGGDMSPSLNRVNVDFHCNCIKKKYNDEAKLLFTYQIH